MDNEKELIGRTGAVTGVETPDPKEGDPSTIYTTTPPESRVGARDHINAEPMPAAEPQAVTEQFDALATRDPQAMEQRPQAPEYAGAENAEMVGDLSVLDAVTPSAGLGVNATAGAPALGGPLIGGSDQNPGYTPPSKMTPPHVSEAPANQPEQDTAEFETLSGDTDRGPR